MKKLIVGTAVSIAGLIALRRLAPSLHPRAMETCREMLNRMSGGLPVDQITGDSPDARTRVPCDPTARHPDAREEAATLAAAN